MNGASERRGQLAYDRIAHGAIVLIHFKEEE